MDVIPLDGDGFMLKFSDLNTRTCVLEGGPWFIAGRPLLLQKWQPGLVLEKLFVKKFPLWVVLRGIPLELLTADGSSCIAMLYVLH